MSITIITRREVSMKTQEEKQVSVIEVDDSELNSLKGTLFSTIVFVGGGIIAFILLLLIVFMIRV